MELTCPKCQGAMRTYERNGVHVDQCAECRGIFLDRGELERLVDAENRFQEAPPPPPGAAGSGDLGRVVGQVLQQARTPRSSGYGSPHEGGKRKKKTFLEQLFD